MPDWLVALMFFSVHGIPHALGCNAYLSVWREVGALFVERFMFFLFPQFPTLYFPLCINVTCAHLPRGMGAHGWIGRFCQSSVQSSSWSWLPVVEAPGCFRHPTSTEQCSCLIQNKYIYFSVVFGF